jgi:hypothetical protein
MGELTADLPDAQQGMAWLLLAHPELVDALVSVATRPGALRVLLAAHPEPVSEAARSLLRDDPLRCPARPSLARDAAHVSPAAGRATRPQPGHDRAGAAAIRSRRPRSPSTRVPCPVGSPPARSRPIRRSLERATASRSWRASGWSMTRRSATRRPSALHRRPQTPPRSPRSERLGVRPPSRCGWVGAPHAEPASRRVAWAARSRCAGRAPPQLRPAPPPRVSGRQPARRAASRSWSGPEADPVKRGLKPGVPIRAGRSRILATLAATRVDDESPGCRLVV